MESALTQSIDNQVATSDSVPAPEPSVFHFHTIPVLIFTLLIILLTSGAFFLGQKYNAGSIKKPKLINLTPTTEPTAIPKQDPLSSWNSYSNSKYNFSLKYPMDWQINPSPVTGNQFNIIISPVLKKDERGFPPIQFSINMAKNIKGNSFTSISEAEAMLAKNFKTDSLIKKDIIIDKKPAISLTGLLNGPGPNEGSFLQYTLIQDNEEVIFTQLGNKEYQDIYDQILSTFHFIRQTQVTSLENWKTYTNTQAGFSLKYPPDTILNSTDKNSSNLAINIQVQLVKSLQDAPLGYTKAAAIQDQQSLIKGEYGNKYGGLTQSEKVIKLTDSLNAKTFTNLQQLEICDVRFDRTAIFYINGYQIIVDLIAPKEKIISESSDYFTFNYENCGNNPIWAHMSTFYSDLESNKGHKYLIYAQNWYNTFDQILSTFKFLR